MRKIYNAKLINAAMGECCTWGKVNHAPIDQPKLLKSLKDWSEYVTYSFVDAKVLASLGLYTLTNAGSDPTHIEIDEVIAILDRYFPEEVYKYEEEVICEKTSEDEIEMLFCGYAYDSEEDWV